MSSTTSSNGMSPSGFSISGRSRATAGECSERPGSGTSCRPAPGAALRLDLRERRVDAREAPLRALFDAVLHRRVALDGRLEVHRLRQLRLLAEVFELERLQMVHERLDEPRGRIDLAELALDDAVRGLELVRAAGADVHLLDDGAVTPPFGDQLRVRPDRVDVLARCVEDALDADV